MPTSLLQKFISFLNYPVRRKMDSVYAVCVFTNICRSWTWNNGIIDKFYKKIYKLTT